MLWKKKMSTRPADALKFLGPTKLMHWSLQDLLAISGEIGLLGSKCSDIWIQWRQSYPNHNFIKFLIKESSQAPQILRRFSVAELLPPAEREAFNPHRSLDIHPLYTEDCLDDNHIPKIKGFPRNAFMLLSLEENY
jgi:hypothetical protein